MHTLLLAYHPFMCPKNEIDTSRLSIDRVLVASAGRHTRGVDVFARGQGIDTSDTKIHTYMSKFVGDAQIHNDLHKHLRNTNFLFLTYLGAYDEHMHLKKKPEYKPKMPRSLMTDLREARMLVKRPACTDCFVLSKGASHTEPVASPSNAAIKRTCFRFGIICQLLVLSLSVSRTQIHRNMLYRTDICK